MRVALVLLSATLLLASCKREAQEAAAQAKGAAADAQRAANEAAARARAAAAEAQRTARTRPRRPGAPRTRPRPPRDWRRTRRGRRGRCHRPSPRRRRAGPGCRLERQRLRTTGAGQRRPVDQGDDRRGPARRGARLRRWRRAEHPPALRPGGDAAHRREDPVDPPWRWRREGGLRQRLHGCGSRTSSATGSGSRPRSRPGPVEPPRPAAGRAHAVASGPRAPRLRPGPLRAEVGRLPEHRLPRRRVGRAGEPEREAADPLLPRAGRPAPGLAARALCPRRRGGHRRAEGARLRRPAQPHPPRRLARPEARRGDAGVVRGLRSAGAR